MCVCGKATTNNSVKLEFWRRLSFIFEYLRFLCYFNRFSIALTFPDYSTMSLIDFGVAAKPFTRFIKDSTRLDEQTNNLNMKTPTVTVLLSSNDNFKQANNNKQYRNFVQWTFSIIYILILPRWVSQSKNYANSCSNKYCMHWRLRWSGAMSISWKNLNFSEKNQKNCLKRS